MSDLTPEEVAFAAELLWGHEYPDISTDEQDKGIWAMNLQADAKHKARGWLLFGRVVEAMREKGWQVTLTVWWNGQNFVSCEKNVAKDEFIDTDDHVHENPAVAAIKAARAALGQYA